MEKLTHYFFQCLTAIYVWTKPMNIWNSESNWKCMNFWKRSFLILFFFQFFRRGDSFFVRMIRLVFHFSKFHLFFKKKGLLGPNRCWNNIVMNFGDSSYKTAEMTDSYFSSRSKMPLPIGICKCKWICLIQK